MRIALGSDHRGFELKARVAESLRRLGHEPVDLGAHSAESSDYPDFAAAVAYKVAEGEAQRGILMCGTGIGVAMAANKVPGIRAGVVHDQHTAEVSRRHNDLNVLCLPGDLPDQPTVDKLVQIWLDTPFEGGRHARRLEKIRQLEAEERRGEFAKGTAERPTSNIERPTSNEK
jgi:ribose 5-phosphate isomerase B